MGLDAAQGVAGPMAKRGSVAKIVQLALLAALIALALFIRFAPSDPERWHRMPESAAPDAPVTGVLREIEASGDALARLHRIILDTPRTRVVAGSVEEGMITYVTRSLILGFPDYTTVRQAGGRIDIWGRQRFGRSDLGVNAARIDRWLERLGQGR